MAQSCHKKTKIFEQITRKRADLKVPLKFLKFPNMQLLPFFENHKNLKICKSGQNWHCYLSIKQFVTLEIIINSFSGMIPKNATVEY